MNRQGTLFAFLLLALQPIYAGAVDAAIKPIPAPIATPAPAAIPTPTPAQEAPAAPANNSVPAANSGQKSIVNNIPNNKPAKSVIKEIIPPVFEKSLMFSADEISKIKIVYKIYLDKLKNVQSSPGKDTNIEDLLGKLNLSQDAPQLPPAPASIYLNSILFRAPGNATAWINGKKYEANAMLNNIKLLAISSGNAEMEWRVIGYSDSDFNDWVAIFPEAGDKEASEKIAGLAPSRRDIRIVTETNSVRFTLKPNQYLDVQAKAIKEGRPTALGAAPKGGIAPAVSTAKEPDKIVLPEKNNDAPLGSKEVKIKQSMNGHYDIAAKINDQVITFRLDTGATYTVISKSDAQRIGIDISKLVFNVEAKTADGAIIKSAEASVGNMDIGELSFKNVGVMVADGNFPQPLLGMSFLNTIHYDMGGGVMTITNPSNPSNPASPPPTQDSSVPPSPYNPSNPLGLTK